jgi:hypothetical protein
MAYGMQTPPPALPGTDGLWYADAAARFARYGWLMVCRRRRQLRPVRTVDGRQVVYGLHGRHDDFRVPGGRLNLRQRLEGEPMANTYTSLHYHLVFSTKNRTPRLTPEIESRVWEYIGGVARHHKMVALQIGGFDDHIHALIGAPATVAPSQIAQYLN